MAVGYRETVLVPRFSRVLSGLVVLMCAVTLVSLVAYGHIESTVRYAPAVLLLAALSLALFWLPRVRIGPAELEVVNPLRTHHVSWPAIRDLSSKWSLSLDTTAGRITVWSAPSPSPLGESVRLRRDPSEVQRGRVDRRPSTAVGMVAERLILAQWTEYRDRGLLGQAEGPGVVTTWNRPVAIVLGVLALLTVAGLIWP